jgi:hypothetical protein
LYLPVDTVRLQRLFYMPVDTMRLQTVLPASITRLKEMLPLYHGEVAEFNYYQ